MDKETKSFLVKATTILLILVAIGVLSWSYLSYRQAQNIISPERTISFSAEGKVFAKPDIAKLVFSVINQGEDAELVQKENNEKMAKALNFVKEQGIKEDDIKTINYNLNPQYDYSWCREKDSKDIYVSCPPKIVGYLLTQSVEVKIRDFNKINDLVGGLTQLGINDISMVSFEIEDVEDYKNQARIEAIKKAEARAKLFSQETSIKLGKILGISEANVGYPVYREAMKAADASLQTPTTTIPAPIESGLEEITVNVTVTYELK
ncbi:MAG TPA: SIMPL domain-containing protein [Candidatus Paceibacterota bacterium]|nr:SIMPL domain-containing protein [Candidatus Paceibacterota bacterium]